MTYVHRDGPLDSECSGSVISIRNSGERSDGNSFTHASGSFAFGTAPAAASSTATPVLGRYSGRGTPTGQRKGSAGDLHPAGHGGAAATITEGVPYGQPSPAQSSAVAASAGAAAAVTSTSAPRVRFEQPDTAQSGSPFAAATGSGGSQAVGAGGGDSGKPTVSDSAGSSFDCKCVAAEMKRSKSSSSQKGASKRFESWLVQEYCDQGAMSHYLGQWPAPCEDDGGDAGSLLRVLQLLLDAARGLQELHSNKVVHGDLVSISWFRTCCTFCCMCTEL